MPRIKSRQNSLFDDVPTPAPIRTGGRVKKAKIVFDPSINNMPRTRSKRAVSACNLVFNDKSTSIAPPKLKKIKPVHEILDEKKRAPSSEPTLSNCCMICLKLETKKGRKLISCQDCSYKVHPACLKINFQNQSLLESHYRCNNCTTCVVCYETSEAGNLIICCICVDAYHLNCHNPKIINKNFNKLKWECNNCQKIKKSKNAAIDEINISHENDIEKTLDELRTNKENDEVRSEIRVYQNNERFEMVNEALILEKNDSQKMNKNTELKQHQTKTNRFEEEISDIADWSCEKVCQYMKKYFPHEVHVFREHEIDGASLLLMKRTDVIRGLALRLGPALRLYNFIVKLQSKSNDPRLSWM